MATVEIEAIRESSVAEIPETPMTLVMGGLIPYKLTIDHYMRMAELQILPDDGPGFELLDGVIVTKTCKADRVTKGIPHDYTVETLHELLNLLVKPGWFAREEKSLVLGSTWRPEPDVIVVAGTRSDFRHRAPHASEVSLIIEVSDSSYVKDRGVKWIGYAGAEIPTYWIVRIDTKCVEVDSKPVGRDELAVYQETAIYRRGDSIPVHVGGRNVGMIAVDEIFS